MAKKDKSLILLNNAIQRIVRRQEYFKTFGSLGEWIFKEDDRIVDSEIKYLEYIKNIVVKKYWEEDIYISSAALDDIIFEVIKKYKADEILNKIDDFVKKSHLHKNSVVIFPLHSFGFKYGGLRHLLGRKGLSYRHKDFQIFSQSNSFKESKTNVIKYLDSIRLRNRKKLNTSLFQHYFISRGLTWFEKNPVMILHFKFSQQERYDNLRFILQKVNFITNKLYFLSALGNIEDKTGSDFSTRNSNSWETLDIKHFLTITTGKSKCILNCIPVHFSDILIYEKMHMNIDLLLKRTAIKRWEIKAIDSIDDFYSGYVKYNLSKEKKYAVYYRISSSLDYFRRSIKSINKEDKIININIAFESLLLDRLESNKRVKMLDRLWLCLRNKITRKKNLKNIEYVINERNEIVHGGVPATANIDFADINRTYCKFILFLHDNLSNIDSSKDNYLSEFYDNLV